MYKNRSLFIALVIAVAALCMSAASALATGPAVTVTISAPAANSHHLTTPNLSFTTTGTGLQKTCTVLGNGVDISEESCSSGWNPGPLADGTYTYGIQVENVDGGMDAASRTFTVDHTAPAVTIGGTPAAGASNAASIALTATVTDANPAALYCRVDGDLWDTCGGTATNGTFNIADAPVGGHSYQFAASDKAGNETIVSRSINIDRTAPAVAITSTGWGNETKDNTPAFLVTATDASAFNKTCTIVGVTAPQACNGSTFLVADPIVDGSLTAKLTATDAAGNTASATFEFTLDATYPQLSYGGVENDRTSNTLPGIEFWATDAHTVTVHCAFDPAGWDALALCVQGPNHGPPSPLTLGTHQFWITATDSFGNVASVVYTFEVVAPGQETPGGTPGGPTGETGGNGGNGGTGKAVPRVALKSKATKVKRGKFTVNASVTLTPAAGAPVCDGAVVVTLTPKVKKAKAVKATVKLAAKSGTCTGTAKFKLKSKLKKKKAGIAVSFAGNTSMAQFTSSPLNVKL